MSIEIVIVTCDAFVHVVPLCIKYLGRHWPSYMENLVTVVANSHSPKLTELQADNRIHQECYLGTDRGWSNNMIKFLKESDRPDHNVPMLLLLEDYITSGINLDLVYECIDTIEMHDEVGMLRLVPIPGPTKSWNDYRGKHKHIGRLDKSTHTSYCMSLQAALWKPRVLLETLEPDLNPWKTEGRGSRRIAQGKICQSTQFLCTYKNAVEYKNLLRRGKPDEKTIQWLKRQGEDINVIRRRSR